MESDRSITQLSAKPAEKVSNWKQAPRKTKRADGSRTILASVPLRKDGGCSWRRHFKGVVFRTSAAYEVYGALLALSRRNRKTGGDGWVSPGWKAIYNLAHKDHFLERNEKGLTEKLRKQPGKKSNDWRFGRRTIFHVLPQLVHRGMLLERCDHPRFPSRRAWLPLEHEKWSVVDGDECRIAPRVEADEDEALAGLDGSEAHADCTDSHADCTAQG